ncbi:hypothetical protein [Streptomyces sp. NBC_00272]|uniref:hypothetical protein n=1 Tax=Streptomyces sp. NBC_00272 TaxID=2975698 RepID=UPI002E28BF20|nr:hypothetical protein [Streptomyces sp. NBC_00272]
MSCLPFSSGTRGPASAALGPAACAQRGSYVAAHPGTLADLLEISGPVRRRPVP